MHQWAHAVWQVSVVCVGRVGCWDSADVFSPAVPKLYFPVLLGKLMGEGFPGHFQPGFFVLLPKCGTSSAVDCYHLGLLGNQEQGQIACRASLTNISQGGISCLVLRFSFNNPYIQRESLSNDVGNLCLNSYFLNLYFKLAYKVVSFYIFLKICFYLHVCVYTCLSVCVQHVCIAYRGRGGHWIPWKQGCRQL